MILVDTKRKELIGGIYDLAANRNRPPHAVFVVVSIGRWWHGQSHADYPQASQLLITGMRAAPTATARGPGNMTWPRHGCGARSYLHRRRSAENADIASATAIATKCSLPARLGLAIASANMPIPTSAPMNQARKRRQR